MQAELDKLKRLMADRDRRLAAHYEAHGAAMDAAMEAARADLAAQFAQAEAKLAAQLAALDVHTLLANTISPEAEEDVLRYVAGEALRKLQAHFGLRPRSQPWTINLRRAATKDSRWLEDRGLGLEELALLCDQPTASRDLVDAPAHAPRPALSLVNEVVQDQSQAWQNLWAFASATS